MLKFIVFLPLFLQLTILSQTIQINEIMSSNVNYLSDEDDDFPDWIEIKNSDEETINLGEYYISDDLEDLLKWNCPRAQLSGNSYFLLFASGKDKRSIITHWETIIDLGDDWRYKTGSSTIPFNWNTSAYDSENWDEGPSGIGYGDNDDNTIINQTISLYLIKKIHIENTENISALYFNMDFDDSFVAYLNGIEVARENIGTQAIQPNYNESSTTYVEPKIINGETPNQYNLTENLDLLVEGENILAVQVHNYGINSSDITAIPILTVGYSISELNNDKVSDHFSVPKIYPHTNFKLSSKGEVLYVSTADQIIIDSLDFPEIPSNYSYGRVSDKVNEYGIFKTPSPNRENDSLGFNEQSSPPSLTNYNGFLTSSIYVSINTEDPSSNIYYTVDGTDPSINSIKYISPFRIDTTTVVKAVAVSANSLPSKVITKSYIFSYNTQLPIISLSTEPDNFFNIDSGIYVLGRDYEHANPHFGANFWEDWERPIHIEYFTSQGELGFEYDAGVKIFGAWSRAKPQKSFAIHFRDKYGIDELNYKLFSERDIDKFKSFVLRNSGNDWEYSMIRDGMMQNIVKTLDLDRQAFQPVVVFLNGVYWGIYNMREKINEDYLASHYGVDKDSVDIIEKHGEIVEGSSENYFELYDFINSNSLALNQNYNFVKERLDINNFLDYFISQIYFDNTDWPGNNIKMWRPQSTNRKFRYLMFDTDFGFGIYDENWYKNNTLEFATENNGPYWPNPPWSTLFLRRLLANQDFKNEFINRYLVYKETVFDALHIHSVIDSLYGLIDHDIENHLSRWTLSLSFWESQRDYLKNFATQRQNYFYSHLTQFFNITGGYKYLKIEDVPIEKGYLNLQGYDYKEKKYSGYFTPIYPQQIEAIPLPGFKFKNWTGSLSSDSPRLNLDMSRDITIHPVFEEYQDSANPIVINEINYSSTSDYSAGDWIELYNRSEEPIEISEWEVFDEYSNAAFIIPNGTVLDADSYLVIAKNVQKFKNVYSKVANVIGGFYFGLSSSGESVYLVNSNRQIIDYVIYNNNLPWPQLDANTTLSLINPFKSNDLGERWGMSQFLGSPGKVNDILNSTSNKISDLPERIELKQNYPNPFNPSTVISYQLSEDSEVQLMIYDILGREIKTLVSEKQYAGEYHIEFDAGNLTSGLYIYQLRAGNFLNSKKMILLR